jgi:CPA2 family monovalent cation:H+ antiporter-2
MPSELSLFLDLAIAYAAALLGGLAASRLRLQPLVGYLLAGLAVGPHTSSLISDVERVRTLSELGVLFLMFGLGVQFQPSHLGSAARPAVVGGLVQILGTVGLGWLVGNAFNWSVAASLYLGCVLALSSTMVVLSLLVDRAEVETPYGRLLLAMLIVQDLSVVPMMVALPAIASGGDLLESLVFALLKAAAIVAGVVVLGARLVPRVLFRVAAARSRELFLVSVVALAFGTAVVSSTAGLSLALGAFLAGVIISESAFTHQVLADVLPLRDLFSILFFVSLGMFMDPAFLAQQPGLVAASLGVVVLGKLVLTALPLAALGVPIGVAIQSGLGMVQVGEFSFVLAESGLRAGVAPPELHALTLVAALLTIPLTPFAMHLGPGLARTLGSLPLKIRTEALAAETGPEAEITGWHAVIAGFGQLGRALAQALERRGFRYLVIDNDPAVIQELRRRNVPHVFGDASNVRVLERAGLNHARVLAVAMSDPLAAEATVRNARRIYPRLDVIARAGSMESLELLRGSGATEIVHPQSEAALEMIRHSLHRFGVSSAEALAMVNRLREQHYGRAWEGGEATGRDSR